MRFLFVTWWGGGNVTPVRVLATELTAAGHDVRVLGPSRLRARCEAAGATYVEQAGGFTASPEELVAELARTPPPDAVVVDFMLPELLAVAEASGIPWAPLVHTLAGTVIDRPSSNVTAFVRLDAVNERRRALGLAPAARDLELLLGAPRILVAGPATVDRLPGTGPRPPSLRYLGAVVEDPGPDAGWQPPGRPLVVVGLGTTPMDELPVVERVLAALADLPAHVVATVGEHADPAAVAAPAKAHVSGLVRHAAVFPHTDVVVSHGGLGTVTNALTFGVPVLCLPLGRDQHDNARRVEELGAGLQLPPDAPAADMSAAVARLLEDDAIRACARRVADAIAAESAPGGAVAAVVELAGA